MWLPNRNTPKNNDPRSNLPNPNPRQFGSMITLHDREQQYLAVSNTNWLQRALQALIDLTIEEDDPQIVQDLRKFRKDGLLGVGSPILQAAWSNLLNSSSISNIEQTKFLLQVLADFNLLVFHQKDLCFLPSLLPTHHANTQALFLDFLEVSHPIYFQFHYAMSSHAQFISGTEVNDHFLPPGLFRHLVSDCAKLEGWKWAEHRYKDLMSYTVADGIVLLSTKSTWIRLSVMVPKSCHKGTKVGEYYKTVSDEVNKIIDGRFPGKC